MNLMTLLKPKGDIEYLHKEDTLRQGLERMRIYGYTALPVIDENGCYAGSVNEGDFLWHMIAFHKCDMQELEGFRIKEIIRKDWMPPVCVYATIDEMVERALNQNYVPVVDDRNVFIGIITRRDIINVFRCLQDQQSEAATHSQIGKNGEMKNSETSNEQYKNNGQYPNTEKLKIQSERIVHVV